MASEVNSTDADDPYLWLEEIASPAVTQWIGARNAETVAALQTLGEAPSFDALWPLLRGA